MKNIKKINLSLCLFVLLLCFACSSKPQESDFIGTWSERDGNIELEIIKDDVYLKVSGHPSASGNYVLNKNGVLISGNGSTTNIQYFESSDIIVVNDSRSTGYVRKKQ